MDDVCIHTNFFRCFYVVSIKYLFLNAFDYEFSIMKFDFLINLVKNKTTFCEFYQIDLSMCHSLLFNLLSEKHRVKFETVFIHK